MTLLQTPSRMVRDPGNRFTENVSFITFVEKTRVPRSLMGQTNHETPKTIQAIMEPSSDLRAFLATLCPQNLQHVEKSNVILLAKSCFQNFLSLPINNIRFPGTTGTRMVAQAPGIKTGMK